MSLGNVVSSQLDPSELSALALERRSLAGLVSVSSVFAGKADFLDALKGDEAVLWARTLVEAGHFDAARDLAARIYTTSDSHAWEAVNLLARTARRTRQVCTVATHEPLVAATNLWILGKLSSALAQIEVALLANEANEDLLLTKALILADKGFLVEAAAICAELESGDQYPITEIEILALGVQIDLDSRAFNRDRFSKFKSLAELPAVTQGAERLIDLLELSLRTRMPDSPRTTELLNRIQRHPWVGAHAFQQGNGLAPGQANQSSIRQQVSLLVVKASRAPHREALGLVNQAIALAQPEDLVSPFLEFGGKIRVLICEAANAAEWRFCDRVVDLLCKQETTTEQALNKRELLIMRLFAAGLTAPEIARDLLISKETVKSHSHHVLGKLGVKTRSEALALLTDRGLIGD